MALIKNFEPLPGFVAENAYHHIAAISGLDFSSGNLQCRVATYKDAATRDAYKTITANLQALSAENEALHKALADASQEQDQVKITTLQRDIAVKSAEITMKAKELAQVNSWTHQDITVNVSDILAANGDVTRADAYAKLKEQDAWSGAVDDI